MKIEQVIEEKQLSYFACSLSLPSLVRPTLKEKSLGKLCTVVVKTLHFTGSDTGYYIVNGLRH